MLTSTIYFKIIEIGKMYPFMNNNYLITQNIHESSNMKIILLNLR